MASVNKVIYRRATSVPTRLANIRLAAESWKDKTSGEKREIR